MAYIDNETINKIRSNVNIVDVISSYVSLTQKGRNFFGICPFHDDHNPSMSVSPEKQIYTCFSCGASGNVFNFIQDYENISFVEAVQKLALQAGIDLGISVQTKKTKSLSKEHQILNLTQMYYKNNILTEYGLEAIKYLKERDIDEKTIDRFGIGLALNYDTNLTDFLLKKDYKKEDLIEIGLSTGQTDVFKNRIMFPLHDPNGQIVGYSGRVYNDDQQAKYVNSKASHIFKKGEILYNYHLAKDDVRKSKTIILVEGFMDVIRLSINNINNVVALMGTAITSEQVNLLKQLRTKIILCLDNDSAGETATIAAGDQLIEQGLDVSVVRLEKYKDPDDYLINMGKEAFLNNVNQSLSYLDYKIKYLKNNSLGNSEAIANNVNIMIKTIDNIKDPILKNVLIKKVAEEFNVNEDIITSRISYENAVEQKNEQPKKVHIKKIKKTALEQACEAIIYLMVNNVKFIKMYIKQIGYLPIDKYKYLTLEIQSYYNKNKTINLADFLTHIESNEEYKATMASILMDFDDQDVESESIHENEFETYRKIIMNAINQQRIDEYKIELSKSSDPNHKKDILAKIAEIKKKDV